MVREFRNSSFGFAPSLSQRAFRSVPVGVRTKENAKQFVRKLSIILEDVTVINGLVITNIYAQSVVTQTPVLEHKVKRCLPHGQLDSF